MRLGLSLRANAEKVGREMTIREKKSSREGGWAFLERKVIGKPGDPMLTRLIIVRTPWGGIYLHRIYRPDSDRDLHDHPWVFASLILSGGYTEVSADVSLAHLGTSDARLVEYPGTSVRTWHRFTVHRMPLDRAHFISEIHGRLITLVVVSKRRQEWGFWTAAGFVPWREYTGGGEVRPGPDPFDS